LDQSLVSTVFMPLAPLIYVQQEVCVNRVRILHCGGTVFLVGQMFDPDDLADPRNLTDPIERIAHQFDGLGMRKPANDERVLDLVVVQRE